MKYKAGDKVRVRKDLVVGERYGEILCLQAHKEECGKIFTIKYADENSCCRVNDRDGFWWAEEMFEEVDKMKETGILINIVTDGKETRVRYKDKVGIAKCHPEDKFNIFVGAKLALERLEEQCKPYAWLKEGAYYHSPSPIARSLSETYVYKGDSLDKRMIERGLAFKTKKEAIAAAKKMLAVLNEGDSNDIERSN